MYRVWRYRGGRDGHETLHQFMNFLGRLPEPSSQGWGSSSDGVNAEQEGGAEAAAAGQVVEGASSNKHRHKGGSFKTADERLEPNTYAGVVIFCVPIMTETDSEGNYDLNTFQVLQLNTYSILI